MATIQRRKRSTLSKYLPYSVAGDPRELTFATYSEAAARAGYVAEKLHDLKDGEEYRHGILLDGVVVGRAVRHPDGSVTIFAREDR